MFKPDRLTNLLRSGALIAPFENSLHLSHPLGQFVFTKFQQVVDTLFAEVYTFDIRNILGRCPADPARHDHRINLEYDAVVDDFVNGERDEVIVFYKSAFVCRIPATTRNKPEQLSAAAARKERRKGKKARNV